MRLQWLQVKVVKKVFAIHARLLTDINLSLWVNASAGSGKTKILIDRVLILLLNAQKGIMCLTFTNAAVKEIKDRILSILFKWSVLDDIKLRSEIQGLFGEIFDQKMLSRARLLYAQCAELCSVYTIHSFCATFSKMADDVIAEHERALVFERALKSVLFEYTDLDHRWNIQIMLEIIQSLLDGNLGPHLKSGEWVSATIADLNKLQADDPQELSYEQINFIIDVLATGSTKEKDRSQLLKKGDYMKVFLRKDLYPKSLSSIASKKLYDLHPGLSETIFNEQRKFLHIFHSDLLKRLLQTTSMWLRLAHWVVKKYEHFKFGRYSYEDLIKNFLAMLSEDPYLAYRLDDNIDHLLIDEAQDNAPSHWRIIAEICSNFFSGHGKSSVCKTLMVVGDVKQSIYGFTGSDPEMFIVMRNFFKRRIIDYGYQWAEINLRSSYRTGSVILRFIDDFFCSTGKLSYLDPSITVMKHEGTRDCGDIEFWTDNPSLKEVSGCGCSILYDKRFDDDDFLISYLVDKIESILLPVEEHRKMCVKPDDIMVLYQRWGSHIEKLSSGLEKRNIQVNRAKMRIKDYPVVAFMINVGCFIIDPSNDLALYKILDSPVFPITQSELLNLCRGRGAKGLLGELSECFSAIHSKIDWMLSLKGNAFEIYQDFLIAMHGSLISSYGSGAAQIIDIFMGYVLDLKLDLYNFMGWIKSQEIDCNIGCRPEGVQVMTIHMSKGKEAQIVFMVDCDSVPENRGNVFYHSSGLPLIADSDTIHHPYCRDLKEANLAHLKSEYWRLLYVALTRARDKLYMLGCKTRRKESWSKEMERFICESIGC